MSVYDYISLVWLLVLTFRQMGLQMGVKGLIEYLK